MNRIICCLLVCVLGGCASAKSTSTEKKQPVGDPNMRLGNFSVSLAVKDLKASREFYEKLGFRVFGGDPAKNWLIMQNGTTNIGLFQGMFDKNILTFNPGWDTNANALAEFDDVRKIQQDLKNRGVTLTMQAEETSTGPASVFLLDPDGNGILIDQHVPKPQR